MKGQGGQTPGPEGGEWSGVKEDAAAKETLEASDLSEDCSTMCPCSHPGNFGLCQGNHIIALTRC